MTKQDIIYTGDGIMEQIKKPLYYDNFTFDDLLEMFQYADDRLCEDFGFTKHDWKNIK